MSVVISVVVCTYNRCDLLAQVMQTLINQTLQKELYEIIIINNNSKDNTSNVSSQLIKNNPDTNIRYILETKQGLAHARNRGWKEARGKYVAYIDDDARAESGWLRNIFSAFINTTPEPLVVGGLIYPFYLSKKPEWFKDEYEIRSWGDKPRFLVPKESFSGSNMIFTKTILEKFRGFNTRVGVNGTTLSTGEETSLFLELWDYYGNCNIFYYSPDIKIFHYTPLEKMSLKYVLKRSFASGQSFVYVFESKTFNRKMRLKLICLGGISSTYLILNAIIKFPKYKHYQNWIFECGAPIIEKIGTILECSGLHLSIKQYILNKSK